jgi:BlaI family penicillinase repressor
MTKRLTKAEEEIMLILWKLKEATVREVMEHLDESGTPYTTVSTVVRVLEKKGFVDHKAVGTTHLYHPTLQKKDYLKGHLSGIAARYFDGSFSRMTAFFARENDLSLKDLRELMQDMELETDHEEQHD